LARRQGGYGRGGRMKIESDAVQILSGVRWGKTLGSPVTLLIENRDWPNWEKVMSVSGKDRDLSAAVTRPRPGHADLSGALSCRFIGCLEVWSQGPEKCAGTLQCTGDRYEGCNRLNCQEVPCRI
jgi:hypothetical protein